MVENLISTDPGQQEQRSTVSSATNSAQTAVIPEKARKALTETRAAIKDLRAGMAKEFGTVTRDIMAALKKAAEGGSESGSAGRIAESMRKRQEPAVEKDAHGLVTTVTYTDGTSRKFAYADDGKILELIDKDGSAWRCRDGIWLQYATDGSTTGQTWEGSVSIDSAGVYCYQDPSDGSCVYERPDGSKLVEDQGGLKMEADENGRVIFIQYPDARIRKFQYGSDGCLDQVTNPDATCWKSSDGLRWFQYGADGVKGESVWFGKLSVDTTGNYTREDAGTGQKFIEEPYGAQISESSDGTRLFQNPDGTVLVEKTDGTRWYTTVDGTHISETATGFIALKPYGAQIEADGSRRITKVTYPDRTIRSFNYDDGGSLVQMCDRDGTTWKREPVNCWVQYKPDGRKTGQVRGGDISVDEQGNCIYRDCENSVRWIEQLDGYRATEAADGSKLETSADGLSAIYIALSSRRFAVSTEGFLRYETREGDKLGEIAFDAVRYRHFFEPEYAPDEEEVAKEKRRLSRITAMDDVRELPAGKTILIKTKVETMTPSVIREVRQITRSMRAAVVDAVEETSSTAPADAEQESSPASAKAKLPKDTAERLLPWFSIDLELTEPPGSAFEQQDEPISSAGNLVEDVRLTEPSQQALPNITLDARSAADNAEPTSEPPKERRKTVAPWSSKSAAAKVEAKSEPSAPEPAKRVAPWSSKPTQGRGEPTSDTPMKRVAPWAANVASTQAEPAPAPQALETVKHATPSSASKITRDDSTTGAQSATREENTDDQAGVQIELNQRGRVLKVTYADKTSREFEYDSDGLLIQLRQQNGRITKKNQDGTWTSYARDGRKMNASSRAMVTVDREGDIIWEFEHDGSTSVQRADGTSLFIDSQGQLRRFLSAASRALEINDAGAMTYDVQADETLEEIAADALRAWSWQVSFHEPTAEEVSEMVLRIVDTNKLTSATQIADGDRLSLPEPDDVAVPQLTPLQRAIHNALSPAPSAGPSSSIAGPSGLVRGGPVRLAEHAVWKDTNERITAISYAGGSIREFRYDSAGQLVEITQPDGQIYTRLDADVWAVKQTYSAADAQAEKVHLSIDSAGTYVCRQLDGTRTFTHTASGYRTLESTDGWKVSRNANNLVDRIAYADGTSCTFEYGPQSQPLSYKDRSDRTWQSSEDGTAWTRYSPEGKVIERQARTTMFINADGEILREDMRREITTMERPDGTKNIEYKNLARVELDTRGKALRYRTRGNRIYSISASGVLLYETKEGDLLPALAMDALMYVHRENREFKPTASDLDRQCELIMQASSLNEGAKLQAGTTLIIPVA